MPKAFLVLNPISGNTSPELRRQKFEQHFYRAGWEYETYQTTGQEVLPEIVQQAIQNGANLVVASGGDGTISGVITGMLGSNIPLGILPSGTGNMFARDVAIPFDLDRALDIMTNEHDVLKADLIYAFNRAQVLNLSVGLSAETVLHTEREKKRRYGIFAYVGTVFANLLGLRLHSFQLEVDGKPYKFRASELMLGNSSLIGIRFLPLQGLNILPDDGKVDVCFIRARTLIDWLGVLGNIITFHPERNARFRTIPAYKSVKIRSNQPLLIQGDGEVLGKTPVDVTILPNACDIIIPCRKTGLLVDRLIARIAPLSLHSRDNDPAEQ